MQSASGLLRQPQETTKKLMSLTFSASDPLPITELPDGPFNMAAYCIGAACTHAPGKTALRVLSDPLAHTIAESWTYAELERAVLAVAAGLKAHGLHTGDRIIIQLDNTSDYAILFFGAIAGGFVPLPTTTSLTAEETRFLIEDSGARLVCAASAPTLSAMPNGVMRLSADQVAQLKAHKPNDTYAATRAEDPAYLIYTSGTTSKPKGVLHAHRVAFGRRPTYQSWYGISANDCMLHAGAFNWTYTLGTGLIDPWANGAEAVIYTGEKKPEFWPGLIRATGATLFAAVPGVYRQILKYAPPGNIDVGRLRHGLMAGEKPPSDLFDEWSARTGTELLEALGMSEISTYISTAPGMERKPGSAGKAQSGRRVAVLPVDGGEDPLPPGQEGLLAIHRSDKGLMLRYWDRAEETQDVFRGDWFIGGDLAVIDERGYITHKGRANDIMKALGYRVSPQEVEAALQGHPGVAEVACSEINVREDVAVIGAFVVSKPGVQTSAEDILDFARAHLATYKRPREVIFVDALPRTRNGKVQRRALAKLFDHQRAPSVPTQS